MSERLDRYFALEAADYLDQLEGLLSGTGRPDLDQLLRLSRGVRGSAQMAGAESVAAVAERLEEGIRSVQGNHVAWSEEVRQLSLRTVGDLKLLVRATSRWGELDDERARSALERWDSVEASPQQTPADDWGGNDLDGTAVEAAGAGEGTSPPPEVPIAALFYDDDGPHVLTPDPDEEMNRPPTTATTQPVPIESLLLDRDAALREALDMRDEMERAMRGVPGAEMELGPTVRELFELLEIAAAGVASRG